MVCGTVLKHSIHRAGGRSYFSTNSNTHPLWAYLALFLIGVVSVVAHEDLIQKEVARRYLQIVNNFDKSPYGGVYWIINVYRVDRALLENSGPLTTYETYMFDVQPKA